MPGLTQTQVSDFYKITSEKPYSVSQIAEYFQNKYFLSEHIKKVYKKVYNFLQMQAGKFLFLLKKEDSILWIRANPQNPLTLIFDKQISSQTGIVNERQLKQNKKIKTDSTVENDLEGLKNARPERWKAAHKCSRCTGFGYTDKETGDFIYTNNIYFECIREFQNYISRIRTENIEMYHSFDGNPSLLRLSVCPIKLVSPLRKGRRK